MDNTIEMKMIYIVLFFILVLWFLKVYSFHKRKENAYDNYYKKILKSDQYKAKGKFEY